MLKGCRNCHLIDGSLRLHACFDKEWHARIVCTNSQSAGLAAWHATCRACHYESAALSVAINEHTGLEVNEAERKARLKALRLANFRTMFQYAKCPVRHGARRLLDVGSAHGWFVEIARGDSTCSVSSPMR